MVGGRQVRPGARDWLLAQPARFGGNLPGRKPIAFCAFLFDALGMLPGDDLVDMSPGTGVVGRAWAEASSGAGRDVAPSSLRRVGEVLRRRVAEDLDDGPASA